MRIYLRKLSAADVTDDYLSWFLDADVTRFLSVEGSKLTKETVIDYINHGNKTGAYFMYGICLKETNEHIGNLKLGPIDAKHNRADLVAVVGKKDYWGKGLATEAISAGVELAFKTYKIGKLSGSIYSGNVGSIKAYTKAGWVIEGRLKNQFKDDQGQYQDEIFVSCFNPDIHQDIVNYYSQNPYIL